MSKRIMVTLTDTVYNELLRNAQQQTRPLSNLAAHYLKQGLYHSATVSNDEQQPSVAISCDAQHIATALVNPPSDPLERDSISSDLLERLSAFLDKTPQLLEDISDIKDSTFMTQSGVCLEWLRSDGALVEKQEEMGCDYSYFKKHRLPPGPKGWKPPEW